MGACELARESLEVSGDCLEPSERVLAQSDRAATGGGIQAVVDVIVD